MDTSFASKRGLRSAIRQMRVASFMRLVADAAIERAMNGSTKCEQLLGASPDGEPGKILRLFTGMNGCSPTQRESNPSFSAVSAMNSGLI